MARTRATRKEVNRNKVKKTIRRRRKRRSEPDEDDAKVANFMSHLNNRFGNKTSRHFNDHPPYLRKSQDGNYEVFNSERYSAMIKRAKDSLGKRTDQGFCQDEYISSRWRCAFCQQRSLRSILGDLFGPYYVKIPDEHWPTFLAKKPQRSEHWFDLWMHGDCVLSAPGIQLCGRNLPALEQSIINFWKQHCFVCSKEGATLEFGGKFFHYPCAYQKGKLGIKRPDAE